MPTRSPGEPGPGEPYGERGSATVYVLAGCLLLVALMLVIGSAGQARVARHQAQAAADLAALAAAAQLATSPRAACWQAERVARANHAVLRACLPDPTGIDVRVQVEGPPLRLAWPRGTLPGARAWARAG